MKDDKLEKQFDEYFKGVNTPDDITGDAKKYVKSKSPFLPKFVKFASVAASFVLVFTAALLVILRPFNAPEAPDNSADNSVGDDAEGGAAGGEINLAVYGDDKLSFTQADAYGVSALNENLAFIEKLAYSYSASVNNCTAGYTDGELTIVKADISLIDSLNRHDTQVYVEFTEQNEVYYELTDYFDGTKGNYRGVEYYITKDTAENGEPLNKLQFTYGSVKYYFNITSSDEDAYLKYLFKIIK